MEGRLLISLGKVAGLGGVAIYALLSLFQDVLQGQFLLRSELNSAQAFLVILSLMILTFGISALGVVAWLIARFTDSPKPVSNTTLATLAAVIVLVVGATVYVVVHAGVNTTGYKLTSRQLSSTGPAQ